MYKTLNLIIFLCVTIMGLTSCKKKHEERTEFDVTVAGTEIRGKLSPYFSVVPKSYKYNDGKLNIELKCTKSLPKSFETAIGIDVLDADDAVITCSKPDPRICGDLQMLYQAIPNQVIALRIECSSDNLAGLTPAKVRLSSIGTDNTPKQPKYPEQVRVTGVHVRLRTSPSTDTSDNILKQHGKVVYPDDGDVLECVGEETEWYIVKYQGSRLYISKQFTEPC